MSRTEGYHEGKVPLHTLRAEIDYGFAESRTTFGRIGVKVWIYKGEKTPISAGRVAGEPDGEKAKQVDAAKAPKAPAKAPKAPAKAPKAPAKASAKAPKAEVSPPADAPVVEPPTPEATPPAAAPPPAEDGSTKADGDS
jgi:small subunit ribosomal protein S3